MGNADSKAHGDFQLRSLLEATTALGEQPRHDCPEQEIGQPNQSVSLLDQFLGANLSAKDVEACLGTPEEILQAAVDHPGALADLLDHLTLRATQAAESASQFPMTVQQSSVLLTTVRVFSRLIPILLTDSELEQRIFWTAHFRCLSPASRRVSARTGGEEIGSGGDMAKESPRCRADRAASGAEEVRVGRCASAGERGEEEAESGDFRDDGKREEEDERVDQEARGSSIGDARGVSDASASPFRDRNGLAPRLFFSAGGGVGAGEAVPVLLGNEIVNLLFWLLFLRGFTAAVPGTPLAREDLASLPKHKLDARFLWKGGVGSPADHADRAPAWVARNRAEVMQCLIACFAGTLYNTVDEYQVHIPTWLRVATAGNAPYTANLFCSLLSLVCAADATKRGLFGSSIFANPEAQDMTTAALQLLIILLDFNVSVFVHPEDRVRDSEVNLRVGHLILVCFFAENTEANKGEKTGRKAGTPALRNVFRSMLSGLHKTEEFDFIYDGLMRLLDSAAYRARGVSPSGKPDLFCEQLLILTWHLLTLNQSFLRHVCSRRGSHALLRPLISLLLDASHFIHRRVPAPGAAGAQETVPAGASGSDGTASPAARASSPATNGDTWKAAEDRRGDGSSSVSAAESAAALSRIGLLHMCSFILLVLSSERDFAVRLNEPFTGKAPADLPVFQGSYADLLCLAVHRVVMDATGPRGSSDSLVDMLLTVLCNVSAYVKSFCLESCLRLMAMMERLTRRHWLFSAPQHYHDVFFLLDVLNNLIQYQFEGNSQLVYAILRQKNIFCDLENLTLPAAFRRSSPCADKAEGDGGNERRQSSSPASAAEEEGDSRGDGAEASPARRDCADADREAGPNGTDERAAAVKNDAEETWSEEEEPWEPTEEWLEEWKQKLPLQTILRLIHCLLPQVEEECARREVTDQQDILQFLEKTTMVGLLPVPHPIIIRNYQPNAYTALWFTSFMWGLLLVSSAALDGVMKSEIRLIVMNP
ncbi:hypothetical protein BESB_054070 [Besnoitia besnoiti]|uniref:High-temperature-induced dauer-formation protein n=1 Tax=Besnoitia besnoiti TaxID=94643 RepID=A0A2A9MIG6_BESBE|nr:hypothetical protein BESB_054070 [Besnoitia besnoiti]PFH35756.1 hypothetical protein BESB_054070 [Besnoitia besnoiti]